MILRSLLLLAALASCAADSPLKVPMGDAPVAEEIPSALRGSKKVRSVRVLPDTMRLELATGDTGQAICEPRNTQDLSGSILANRCTWTADTSAVKLLVSGQTVRIVPKRAGFHTVRAVVRGLADTARVAVLTTLAGAPEGAELFDTTVTVLPHTVSLIGPTDREAVQGHCRDPFTGPLSPTPEWAWTVRDPAVIQAISSTSSAVTLVPLGDGQTYVVGECVIAAEKDSTLAVVSGMPPLVADDATCGTGCRWVATTGSDANAGTEAAPYRTIQKANSVANAGDSIMVQAGVYNEQLVMSRGGTVGSYVTVSCVPAAFWNSPCVLDGQSNTLTTALKVTTNYVRFGGIGHGFQMRHYLGSAMEFYTSGTHHIELVGNEIHNIGRWCYTGTNSKGGISVGNFTADILIDANYWHDNGRLGNGENGCSQPNTNWHNHDHGIYVAEADRVTIRNNVFKNHPRGWAIQRYASSGYVSDDLIIVNNTFDGANPNRPGHIIIYTRATDALIACNIFNNPTTAALNWSSGATHSGAIERNLSSTALNSGTPTGMTQTGNLSSTSPGFVSSSDFHLAGGSAAIDGCTPISGVTYDHEGTTRTASPEIGAYEF